MAPDRPSLAELCLAPYDLLVVGGGINGAGIAREAAGRGLKVLLVEERDYAFGASSRSTKLLHGGLRYLEHMDLTLVSESLRERRLACALAPHLTRPLPFLIPVYQGDQRPAWLVRLGLWFYDALALKGRALLHAHRWLSPSRVRALAPNLDPQGLKGAAEYWDCQMDDARYCLEVLQDAERLGAKALNYCSLQSALSLREGQVRVQVRDQETGAEAPVQARLIVMAAGAWTDEACSRLGLKSQNPRVRPTKGVHLVTRRLIDDHALLVPARDGRVFFVLPWDLEGKPASLIGTTDTDFKGDAAHVRTEDADIEYLLKETARVLPGEKLVAADIWASFAGLRPLSAAQGPAEAVPREHKFWQEPGLLAITGGKYTTWRSLAQEAVELAAQRLGLNLPPSQSALPLPGAPESAAEAVKRHLCGALGFEDGTAQLLVQHYGRRAYAVADLCKQDPSLAKLLAPSSGCPAILAMAAYAALHEGARHLDDFYLRRTRLGLRLAPDHAGVDRVAAVMGKILGWDKDKELEELGRLRTVIGGEYR